MLGTEKLKLVLVAAVKVADKIDVVTQDGFQVVSDSVALIPNLSDLVVVLKDGKAAVAELKDLDADERTDLLDTIKEELDLIDDKLENVIEKVLVAVNAIADAVVAIREAKA